MYGKSVLFCVLLTNLLTAQSAQASSDLGCRALGGNYVTVIDGLLAVAPNFSSLQCMSKECVAARDGLCATQAVGGLSQASGMVYQPAAQRRNERTHERILTEFGTTHRERQPLYCTILASIAAQTNGDAGHDRPALEYVADLYLRLRAPPRGCAAQISAAFPQTEAVQRSVRASGARCLADPHPCQPAPPHRRRNP